MPKCLGGLAALAIFAASGVAAAAGEAIPLVPIDASDAGSAPPPAPNVVITVVDAGSPQLAVPRVSATDAGVDAVPLVPIVDAGADLPTAAVVIDAGAPGSAASADDAGAASADAGAPASDGGKAEPDNPNFVKGELSQFLGANRIAVQTTRVGVGIGVDRIDNIIYALLEPRLDLHLGDFGLGLAVPLNLEVYNAHLDPNAPAGSVKFIGTKNFGHVRTEDYQTPSDYARVLQYLTYGKKEDHLYIDVGQIYAETLGHGEIMRRYQPNIDLDMVRLAAEVDAYNDYAGAEVLTNDLLRADIIGGLIFVKPLSFVSEDKIARSFSVGATYAIDRTAPDALTLKSFPGSGLNGCDCRPVEEFAPGTDANSNPQRFALTHTTHAVSLFGVDAEVKVVKTDDIDVKPYVDFSHLNGGDSGLTLGVLGRFNFLGSPVTPTHAVRVVLELRYLGDRYRPEYFDTFYEVDKYIFLDSPKANVGQPITQQQAVLQGFGNRVGYYTEASYAIVNWVSATLALEGDSSGPGKNLIAHVELPKLFVLQLFGTYYKRGFDSFSTLTQLDQNSVAFAGARIELLPILYVNGRAYQTFQLDADNTHTFQTTRGVEGDVELGWQF